MRSGEFHTLNNVCAAMDPSKLLWGRVKTSSDNRKIYTTSQLDWMNVELFFYFFTHLTTLLHKSISLLRLTLGFSRAANFSDNTIFLKAFFSSSLVFLSIQFSSILPPEPLRHADLPEDALAVFSNFLLIFIAIFSEWFRSESFANGTLLCMRNIFENLPKNSCRSMSWKMCNRCKQTRVILEPSSSSVFAIHGER